MSIKLINPSGREVDIREDLKNYYLTQGFKKIEGKSEESNEGEETDSFPPLPENLEVLKSEEIKELAKTLGIKYTNKAETVEKIKAKYESEV